MLSKLSKAEFFRRLAANNSSLIFCYNLFEPDRADAFVASVDTLQHPVNNPRRYTAISTSRLIFNDGSILQPETGAEFFANAGNILVMRRAWKDCDNNTLVSVLLYALDK